MTSPHREETTRRTTARVEQEEGWLLYGKPPLFIRFYDIWTWTTMPGAPDAAPEIRGARMSDRLSRVAS